MEKTNEKEKLEFEALRNQLSVYKDTMIDMFGKYFLTLTDEGNIYLLSEDGVKYKYVKDNEENKIKFFSKNNFDCDEITIFQVEDKVAVSERKVEFHEKGACVECIDRIYGKSSITSDKNTLLDLRSINYVVDDSDFYSISDLFEHDIVENASKLTTKFSAHMRFLYRFPDELRLHASTMYPTHVYFNNEDISYVYEFVYGGDKVKRIYDLYKGNLKINSSDFKMLKTGLVDERSFNFQYKEINEQVEALIGKKLNINHKKEILEEQIKKELNNYPTFEDIKNDTNTSEKSEITTQKEEKPKSFIKRLFAKKN